MTFLIMKEIKLTQGKVALVDDEDYEYLNQFKWHTVNVGGILYASRNLRISKNKRISQRMQWVIMGKHNGMVIDHIDHNGLNNQKNNLRICTPHQNFMNQSKQYNTKSGYKGVGYVDNTIRARICISGKLIHLGTFKTEREAAMAYDEAALRYFGEYASLNFSPGPVCDRQEIY
jgi:hypothetical protein